MKKMKKKKKYIVMLVVGILLIMCGLGFVYADYIGNTGSTDQGNITGTNVYTFNYNYDSSQDAITLTVNTLRPINGFGGTTSHTFSSPSDNTVLNTSSPQLGSSLDSAIQSMIRSGGYSFTVAEVKSKLQDLGYYDKGNGVWKTSGGYLTYVSAVKIRPIVLGGYTPSTPSTPAPSYPDYPYYPYYPWWPIATPTPTPTPEPDPYPYYPYYPIYTPTPTPVPTPTPTPLRHTITYNANGGSGAPGNQTKVEGTTLYLSSQIPVRTGYTFRYWTASVGGTYNPGGAYTRDQDGGTVTMTANWADSAGPECSEFSAVPNSWSAGNGTVTFKAIDQGSGLNTVTLQRYSYVTGTWMNVQSWSFSGSTAWQTGTYTESAEGVFYYKLTLTDVSGNTTTKTSAAIYLDHSNPVLISNSTIPATWTNVKPKIEYAASDYLSGTSYNGSGVASVVIKDDTGRVVASGVGSSAFQLTDAYEGVHVWSITATDNVGHSVATTVTTMLDVTKPGLDGTEVNITAADGTVTGYCRDNIIDQHMDDEATRSSNGANSSSGIKSVILYKITDSSRTAIYSDRTKKEFASSDPHSSFDMYYEIPRDDDASCYYEIIVKDFAGNVARKKLVSQRSLLTKFHTSIERESYN